VRTIEADYVIVGAGTMGLACADTLLNESDATMVIVDQRGRPGGHWTDAYPFVRLHQPSAFYGVNSTVLGNDSIDAQGPNEGLYELASGAEVCLYFDHIMQRQMLPSGRVTYLPLMEYTDDGDACSLVTGESIRLVARRRTIDASYMNVVVPSMRQPPFSLASEVTCVPLNSLGSLQEPAEEYVIIGAGKSGMDACLWLLANGLEPGRITWITPRDSWLLDRAKIQFVGDLWEQSAIGRMDAVEASARAKTIDELFAVLERTGQLMRLNPNIKPTMYRCATVTRFEVEQLRRIQNIVRMGRVQHIDADRLVLEQGELEVRFGAVFVDCTADGLPRRPVLPIFAPERITLQTVRTCQQAFSAALVAHVETMDVADDERNALCQVVPHPDSDVDWLSVTLGNFQNSVKWMRDERLRPWLQQSRLDGPSRPPEFDADVSPQYSEALRRSRELTGAAMANLQRLLEESIEESAH